MKAEIEGTKKNKNIRKIENAGLQVAGADNDEIGDTTVADQPVQEVAETSSGNERQRYPGAGVFLGEPQQVGQTSGKQQSNTDIEEKEAKSGRQATDHSQKAAMIFNE